MSEEVKTPREWWITDNGCPMFELLASCQEFLGRKAKEWASSLFERDELKRENEQLRSDLALAKSALETVKPNMERIQREVEQCKKAYSMTMTPTIGIGFVENIDKVLASLSQYK